VAHDLQRATSRHLRGLGERKLDLLAAVHDGAHFIETPNPVMVLTGFKSIGPAAAVTTRDGAMSLVVTPVWDRDRADPACPGANGIAADDVVAGLATCLAAQGAGTAAVGLAGLSFLRWAIARRIVELLPGAAAADDAIDGPAAVKTDDEIAHAREATHIAEAGYGRLLEIAKPGVSEDGLAVELKWHSKSLGAGNRSRANVPRWQRSREPRGRDPNRTVAPIVGNDTRIFRVRCGAVVEPRMSR
jgi:Xaa-Pro aminopeptidase